MNDNVLISLDDLEGVPAATFENVGDSHVGKVVAAEKAQQTNIDTGEPMTWADGRPREQLLVTLEKTTGERVILYARGGNFTASTGEGQAMQKAIGMAIKAAGAPGLQVGADLAVVHSGLGEAQRGKNAPKLYTAQYRPPVAVEVAASDLFAE